MIDRCQSNEACYSIESKSDPVDTPDREMKCIYDPLCGMHICKFEGKGMSEPMHESTDPKRS